MVEEGKHGALLLPAEGQLQAPVVVVQLDVHVGDEDESSEKVTCGGMKVTRPPEASWEGGQQKGRAGRERQLSSAKNK